MDISFSFLINIIILLTEVYLGLIVIFHNPKSFSNRFFLALVFFIALQGIIQSFVVSTNHSTNFDTQSRLSIFTIPAQLLFLLLFLIHFPRKESLIKLGHILISYVFVGGLMFLVTTPLVFKNFIIENGIAKPTTGLLFPVFGLSLGILVFSNIFTIFYRYFKSAKEYKKQIAIIGTGIIISFTSLFITQFILPNYFGIPIFLNLISIFTLPMLVSIGYAIVGFKIFNVRIIPAEVFTLLIWALFILAIFFRPTESVLGQIFIMTLIVVLGILLTKNITNEVKRKDELQKLTTELEAANKKLIDLDKLKTEFLSFASHQVKTPMIVVKGFAQLIFDGTYGKVAPEVKDAAQKIKQSADKMIVLVNNILDLSRIEEGRMSFKFDDVDINKMVTDISEELKFLASSKGLTLKFTPLKNALMIKADVEKIRQVFQNLVDNSVKYTPKGSVNVAIKDEGDNILFSVIDTGIGLSKELQVNLFQRFVRDQKIKAQIQGTGLGLYIAKQIVEAHKGQIWAESDGEGLGSRFFVRLPKVQAVSNIPAPNDLEKSKPVNS